jgi:hypothetical protein
LEVQGFQVLESRVFRCPEFVWTDDLTVFYRCGIIRIQDFELAALLINSNSGLLSEILTVFDWQALAREKGSKIRLLS